MANVQLAVAGDDNTQVILSVPGVQGPTGSSIPPSGTTNQILFKQSNTDYGTAWSFVTNAMVDSSAAIAGTKISPNFGSQNVVTTGTSTAASFIPTSSGVPTNGIYLSAANSISIATNSTQRLLIDSAGQIEAVSLGSAAAPTYSWTGDPNTGIYSPGADQVAISTNGTGRLFVDASGRVGIGIASTGALLSLNGSSAYTVGNSGLATQGLDVNASAGGSGLFGGAISFGVGGGGRASISAVQGTADNDTAGLVFNTHVSATGSADAVEAMRITHDGRLLVGTSTSFDLNASVQSVGTGAYRFEGFRFGSDNGIMVLGSANGTQASPSVLTSPNLGLGIIQFRSYDGAAYRDGASIYAVAESEWASADCPTRLVFATTADGASSPTERMRIDSSGRLLVGTSSALATGNTDLLQVSSSEGATLSLCRFDSTVSTNEYLGGISFLGRDTFVANEAALIKAEADAAHTDTSSPGRLVFSTTTGGASSPTERMRITQDGEVLLGNTAFSATANMIGFANLEPGATAAQALFANTEAADESALLIVNRHVSDGKLVQFRHANTTEGTISVSGTTVTYGGGHLARWSQLPSDEDPSGILKGTVMSNLDEMCEWGEEDNEQLNKTKVSEVEGDPNVAGVFVSTSFDEDGPLDFFVAMTGDMIIRIAEGVTVQRGDLLMSAGDGTAKPQDDDIIRSKTIAKVTSTHVTCTYDDGSYCVPCVLMAC